MSSQVTINSLKEYHYIKNKLSFILEAKQKTINPKLLKKMHLFNRKKIMSEAMFYTEGTLFTKNINISFERAYFFEGNIYMQDCYSKDKNATIKARNAVYTKDFIEYKNLKLDKSNKIYHKFKYRVNLK